MQVELSTTTPSAEGSRGCRRNARRHAPQLLLFVAGAVLGLTVAVLRCLWQDGVLGAGGGARAAATNPSSSQLPHGGDTPSCPRLPLKPPATLRASAPAWAAVAKALDGVDRALDGFARRNPGSGAQVAVTYRDQLLHQRAAGCARAAATGKGCLSTPAFNESVWRLGSVTKVFTALMLMNQVDKGVVRLDDPLSKLVSGFTAAPGASLGSICAQLGGLVREVPLPCRADESDCNYTTAQLLRSINAQGNLWPPDLRPSYSNLGFSLLGQALTPASGGLTYQSWVEAHLLKPLGMHNSGFELTNKTTARWLASGTRAHHKPTRLGWADPNGGMHATASDMASFLKFLGGGGGAAAGPSGGVLSAATMRKWFLPRYMQADGISGFGLPWEIQRAPTGWVLTKSVSALFCRAVQCCGTCACLLAC